jgi:hypothetical protein
MTEPPNQVLRCYWVQSSTASDCDTVNRLWSCTFSVVLELQNQKPTTVSQNIRQHNNPVTCLLQSLSDLKMEMIQLTSHQHTLQIAQPARKPPKEATHHTLWIHTDNSTTDPSEPHLCQPENVAQQTAARPAAVFPHTFHNLLSCYNMFVAEPTSSSSKYPVKP